MTKICQRCKQEKSKECFSKSTANKDGLQNKCKECAKELAQIQKSKNPEEYNKKCRLAEEKRREAQPERVREQSRKSSKKYLIENPNKVAETQKKSRNKHKETSNATRRIYAARKKLTDPLFKLRHNIGSLILLTLKNGNFKKTSKTANILGCSFEEFQTHIENQFQTGMSWENQGEWHMDHLFPISWATNEAQAIMLNHHSNYRPLWAVDNMFKRDKAPYIIDQDTGEISILLDCDKEYILNNLETLEAFLKEFNDLA